MKLIILFLLFPFILNNHSNIKEYKNLKIQNDVNEKILFEYITSLNINYPYIVLAQAKLESNNFNSNIFKENNNLFGMKYARQRATTSLGVKNKHAFYSDWKQSVLDYALFYNKYLSKVKSEEEYLKYLSKVYSEDKDYLKKLKSIIKKYEKRECQFN
jgi:flagellum-specific peptidoglycan hydrolase FlgJ